MRLMLPILRADFKVAQTYAYVPDAPLDCSITAYGGLQDPQATRQDLEAWREQTTASFSVKMFQGDHFFLHLAETFYRCSRANSHNSWPMIRARIGRTLLNVSSTRVFRFAFNMAADFRRLASARQAL